MRIRMLKTAAGPGGVMVPGTVWNIAVDQAKILIEAGAAVAVEAKVEVAAVKQPETTAKKAAPAKKASSKKATTKKEE